MRLNVSGTLTNSGSAPLRHTYTFLAMKSKADVAHKGLLTEEPPLTLEEINERLLKVEDIVTLERDLGEASRVALFAMIAALHRKGMLDAGDVAKTLQGSLSRFDDQSNVQLALRVMIKEIENAVAWQASVAGQTKPPRQ